jgi:hypothetical protein
MHVHKKKFLLAYLLFTNQRNAIRFLPVLMHVHKKKFLLAYLLFTNQRNAIRYPLFARFNACS